METEQQAADSASAVTDGGEPASAQERPATQPSPLFLGVSIHGEGWTGEVRNRAVFERHRDIVLELAAEAHAAGVVFTFELNRTFIEGARVHGDDVVPQTLGLGQGVAIHADVGGQGTPPLEVLRSDLARLRAGLAELGVQTTHVSGIC